MGEVDARGFGFIGSASKFDELISGFGVKDADEGASRGSSCHHRPLIIHSQVRQVRLVSLGVRRKGGWEKKREGGGRVFLKAASYKP